MNFFSTSEQLKNEICDYSLKLLNNINFIFPEWFQEDANICSRKMIICGSVSKGEIRELAKKYNIVAIVDDNLSKKWKWFFGFPLISTSTWIDMVKSDKGILSLILVGTLRAYVHFIKQAIQFEFKYLTNLQIIQMLERNEVDTSENKEGLLFRYGYKYFDYALKHVEELLSQTDLFADEYSKISYLNILKYKLTLNPYFLETFAVGRGSSYDYNTYLFERSYIELGEQEVYVDAGAYTGDSIEQFLIAVKGNFKYIYSFEPDVKNNIEIRKRIERLQNFYLKNLSDSISILNKGVWSIDKLLEFGTSGDHDLGGHIVDSEIANSHSQVNNIEVTSIDLATNQDATFIKYEVEGSELEGLIGARKTIEKNRPKLAVAVYHKPEDILTLPQYIKSLNLDYKIGFRQHDLYKPDATYIYCV